jgi:predicted O-linked N-acetylglucosamine transferase (SPINDLY family)
VTEDPNQLDANSRLLKEALSLHRGNSLLEAKKLYTQIHTNSPTHFDALQLLGLVAFQQGMHEDAIRLFSMALKVNPKHAVTHFHLGLTFKKSRLLDKALMSFGQAIEIDPQFAKAYQVRGNTFVEMANYDLAFKDYQRTIQIKPDSADAFLSVGNLYKRLKQYPQAIEAYKSAKAIQPKLPYLNGILLNTKMLLCDWDNFDQDLKELESAIESGEMVSAPFPLLSLSESQKTLKKSSELYGKLLYPANGALGVLPRRNLNGKIRIGYFSADFHEHATAYLTAELFELHDPNRFEIYAFSYGPTTNDPMQKRIQKAFYGFIDISNKSDLDAAKLARDLNIDIAVDLKGYTQDARPGVFAYRAAPLQVSYLGYPGTIGTEYMDYLIADKTVIPEEDQSFYTEKILYMPHCYQVNDQKREVSPRIFSKLECGLPENSFIFCCFNNSYKITPSTFNSWMNILKDSQNSVLWLLESHPESNKNLRKEAAIRGVDPNRLIFAKRLPAKEHLSRIKLADLFLDTRPYNAHTSASDALWMGVPVLTQFGKTFPSRVASSLLTQMELPDLITASSLEYEALAIHLTKNPNKLCEIKNKLQRNKLMMPLFNTKLFATNIEDLYQRIFQLTN